MLELRVLNLIEICLKLFHEYLSVLFYYNIATEAHDDDGLPHTLEHLVFMGSENYPYKVRYSKVRVQLKC